MFQYPLNLHYSQTMSYLLQFDFCFNTLWIYTTLKQILTHVPYGKVSIPSEFTLLSNPTFWRVTILWVSIPSEFTLLSNSLATLQKAKKFQYPLNLHYSQTISAHGCTGIKFQYPLNLHYSQTREYARFEYFSFQYPLNLHYSQTHPYTLKPRYLFQYPLNLHYSQTPLYPKATVFSFQYPLNLHYSQTMNITDL